jgi:mono/diheme cytochrome c family protein
MAKAALLLALILVVSLAACGGESAPAGSEAGTGDAAAGEKAFAEVSAPACSSCHSLEPDVTLVGPSLDKIGAQAGARVSGESAGEYLRKAVVEPNAFVVEGFAPNLMPGTYATQLSEQQIDDLVAYMLTLK